MKILKDALSLGLGVQSTALYYMSALGEIPLIDIAIFVDVGKEKKGTYNALDFLLNWQAKNNGPQVIVVKKKNLYVDLLNSVNSTGQRFSSIPAFTLNEDGTEGMLRRQCTNEYKIQQVDQAIREYLDVKQMTGLNVNIWKGISSDEADRMAIPEQNWKTHFYPFIGYAIPGKGKWFKLKDGYSKVMNRMDITKWYSYHGIPVPSKSSCTFCPYQSDQSWARMKVEEPDDFSSAVKVDYAMRNSSQKGITHPVFLHRSLKPLDQVDFDPNSKIEFGDCSGTCHN